jgi:hypothetical protein
MKELYSAFFGLITALIFMYLAHTPLIELHGPNSKDVIEIFHEENNQTYRLRPFIIPCINTHHISTT